MLSRIKTLLGNDWTATLDLIRSTLKSEIGILDQTNEAILSTSGKQLRPIMSLLIARAVSGGQVTGDSIRYAAASEILHNATLLHDDVADSSPVRRGSPTVLSLLGGPASVLIGDYWLVKAMDVILSSDRSGMVVIRAFAKTLSDLAEGEMLQLEKSERCDTTEEDYLKIIYNKTASLFEAAGVAAAISVDAPVPVREAVREYCRNLGLAFQIKDDILDYSSEDAIGKPVGIDLKERKITLPLLGALAVADPETDARIRGLVMEVPDRQEYISTIQDFVRSSGGIEYATARMEEYSEKAIAALSVLPPSEEKGCLAELAVFAAGRNK